MKIHKKKKSPPKKTKLEKKFEELENQVFAQKLMIDELEKRLGALEAPYVVSAPYVHVDPPDNGVKVTWTTTSDTTLRK
jgi:predicted nuclease with TOPRIM domain